MKIAILGGGFTGLTASYYLAKKHEVTLFEKEKILGGLASGFKADNWEWFLERTIHHVFANDYDILNFAKEIYFDGFFFQEPQTASLYEAGVFPLDTPQDLLRLPQLSMPQKIRSGLILAFLKFSPFLSVYERQTAEEFLKKTMGKQAWDILWRELFRKKFGKYAGNILASFIWARIKKRTKKLGYVKNGFQKFIDFIARKNKSLGVRIENGVEIDEIKFFNSKFLILNSRYDIVISTLPTPVLIKIGKKIFPEYYLKNLGKIKYLHGMSLILETDKPILDKAYWLNIINPKLPMMGIFQQTNFIDKVHYGGKHITYVGDYVDNDDKRLKMTKEELLNYYLPYLKMLHSQFSILNSFLFKALWAQPIFDKDFLKNKPDFETPVKNFFIANLDMTYPYDRGTNYAVKLGKELAQFF